MRARDDQPRIGKTARTIALAVAATAFITLAEAETAVRIEFASGSDDSGTVQRLIDDFNEAHRNSIHVTWRELDRDNDIHRRQLVEELTSASSIDLLASDVVWTAEFAKNGWVVDLTDRFYADYDRATLLPEALGSAIYRLRIWGVPWYTDAGLLFYRRDLLAAAGYAEPPATWDELRRMSVQIMNTTPTRYGFVFQGAAYEGGTVNAAEFIWSAGGELMTSQPTVIGMVMGAVAETDAVRVDSDAAAHGFEIARSLMVDDIAPPEVTRFREREALDAFIDGDAAFLRGWPYAYRVLRQAGFTPDQIGVAPLPAASADLTSASCLGGWNLMINASSNEAEQDAAWQLVRYLTDASQQKRQARAAGQLPVLATLYDDPDLVAEFPVMRLGKSVFTSRLHKRPMSPFYSEMSAKIASAFNRVLDGESTPREATKQLDEELRAIVVRNR